MVLKFESFIQKEGFQKCNVDHRCFFKRYKSSYIILLLYVDDMLVIGLDMGEIKTLKMQLSKEFDMEDLGPTKKILIFKSREISKKEFSNYLSSIIYQSCLAHI